MALSGTWEVIRRRKRVILQSWIGVTIVAVMGSCLVTPAYQASSKILVMKAKKDAVDTSGDGLSGRFSVYSAVADVDHAKVLALSGPYNERVVSRLQLRDKKGRLIRAHDLSQARVVDKIKRWVFPRPSISIAKYEQTDVLQIETSSPDPEEAMMMANTLAEIVVEENRAQVRAECKNARVFLEDQMGKVNERYRAALLKLTDFKRQAKSVDLETETKLAAERMAELMKEKEDGVIALAQARARLGFLRQQLSKKSPEFLLASTSKENSYIETIKERLTDLKLQLAEASAQLTEKHPKILSLKEQIDTAEAELKRETEICRSSMPELTRLETQIPSLEARLKGLNASIDKSFKEFSGLPHKAFEQASLDMDLEAAPSAYGSLLDSLCHIAVTEATAFSGIRIIEPAVEPLSPAHPNKALNGVLGMFVGLALGFGLAFITERLDDTIRTAEDVRGIGPIAFIGAVPKFGAESIPLISARDPNDPLCESYRGIRTQIDVVQHMADRPLQTLMITSAGPKEGKTTTAVNLGISMAREGKKVVIVDMDLRRPSLHTYFGPSSDVGLADLLQNETFLDEAIHPTQVDGLSIITGGLPIHDPGALIESGKTGELISELTNRYDVVILDTAPLLVKSDALVLAQHVDSSVIVLESEKTTRRAVYELMQALTRAHVEPLGFVLNGCPVYKGKCLIHRHVAVRAKNHPQVKGPDSSENPGPAVEVFEPPGAMVHNTVKGKMVCEQRFTIYE